MLITWQVAICLDSRSKHKLKVIILLSSGIPLFLVGDLALRLLLFHNALNTQMCNVKVFDILELQDKIQKFQTFQKLDLLLKHDFFIYLHVN